MTIDPTNLYNNIQRLVEAGVSVKDGMNELTSYCDEHLPNRVWGRVRYLDFDQDVKNLKEWLEEILTNEPPAAEIQAFWFGLYKIGTEEGDASCGMYVAGSDQFRPTDKATDWACNICYNPDGQSAASVVLHQIFRMVRGEEKEVATVGEYGLLLGYASLAVAELCRAIDRKLLLGDCESRRVAVGWDSGDFLLLPTVFQGR